ncbi:hypothetical protein QCA50_002418 [Cerrena zonata]|uniref:FYVE, RhoGEF and PH domain-containing protein 6 n=1 Tax=Cerrena zonata TaxID=2478898 RepID=A0AAW0GPA4_9APHY
MAQDTLQPSAMVDFPRADPRLSAHLPDHHFQPAQHLAFRRISLPSVPNLQNRHSVVSTLSIDSLPEDKPMSAFPLPSIMRDVSKRRSGLEGGRRQSRRREVKIVDEYVEAKKRKVAEEFYETERSYVDGLELIYSHFLTPIVAALDTPQPLLDRTELTSVFSNFIDIWNLHRSFFSSLTNHLRASSSETKPPPLSPVLLSHFPYLSLYTPFITSFPNILTSLSNLLLKHQAFAEFVASQEADPRCGKLKLRDWLLTIVQRCPRYLLLLKDLLSCTDQDDSEFAALTSAHNLVSKITISLNTSLHTHAQTLSLLALQRSTTNLPFQLITPGRMLLKRASLLQLEGSTPKEHEFLLFSDRIVWFASADKVDETELSAKWELPLTNDGSSLRPPIARTRSKSDADVPQLKAMKRRESGLKLKLSSPSKKKIRHASSGTEDRWVYKGHLDLVDLEVVVATSRDAGDERRLEVLSPQKSFALYTSDEEERDEWISNIRSAKASLLVSLHTMNPNSTLTSSSSTNHLRRALQALPYLPDEEDTKPKRGKVEHFVPAIWIPDGKTESCMRCGRTFGWRRRRHHCRLCGRCVCAGCSEKTFIIFDPNSKNSHKPARSCGACYDTVFPVLDPAPIPAESSGTISHLTLSGLRSMPSLLLSESNTPSALMAIPLDSPKRPFSRVEDPSPTRSRIDSSDDPSRRPAIRMKAPSRPRSYIQILEDFNENDQGPPSTISESPNPVSI